MNPILPREFFIPDGEAHVMPDGRLYLYGSTDINGSWDYCSNTYQVFSTDDPKLETWTHHGISFSNTEEDARVSWRKNTTLFAPDAIHFNGRYYLYFCGRDNFEGVAESDRPEGPFHNAKPIHIADGDSIDPAIFVDDDGQAYYFWGQFNLRGGKLQKDMCTLEKGSIRTEIVTEHEHGFHEGSSVRKRNGKYYLVYADISRGMATCLSYAVADHPLGPYTKGGVLIDNCYCDPKTWNNHGSIEEFQGQWYLFYHRSSQNRPTCRRACAERIYFNEDGSINEVEMTSQGASDPIDAFRPIDASLACRMRGNGFITPDENLQKEILCHAGGGSWRYDWAEYKYLNFKDGAKRFRITAKGQGTIILQVDDSNVIGECEVYSDVFETFEIELKTPVFGVQAFWLLFNGKEISVDTFVFDT